mmetsp:Transcript_7065/g.17552  ORF Transcript_7065/g.17552 Transcript_7065/m.17552 type:complete len:265 (-) Transcript_7065:99-893(-)
MSTMEPTYFRCSEGTTTRRRIFHVSPSAGMRPVPMTNSKISDSRPLEKLFACVCNISRATSLSDTTTNFLGPMASTNISPYARKSLYSGTKTGCPAISRMSPMATGILLMASLRHLRESLASWSPNARLCGSSTFFNTLRIAFSTVSPMDVRGLVNSPDAIRSSRVAARTTATRRPHTPPPPRLHRAPNSRAEGARKPSTAPSPAPAPAPSPSPPRSPAAHAGGRAAIAIALARAPRRRETEARPGGGAATDDEAEASDIISLF